MGYELRAVIAGAGLLEAETRDLAHAVLVPLEQNLTMLPITEEFFDSVASPGGSVGSAYRLRSLPHGFATTLEAWSYGGPVAYVYADFFGGIGRQEAAVWENGRFVVDPLHLSPREKFGPVGSPISQALRRLGVVSQPGSDEFEAAGLRRHRHIEDWLFGV